jgi:hypothetical protein
MLLRVSKLQLHQLLNSSYPPFAKGRNSPLWKRGAWGDFMENRLIQKIPFNPPLPKGEDARKNSQAQLERFFLLRFRKQKKDFQKKKNMA